MESDQENHDKHVFEWFFLSGVPFCFTFLSISPFTKISNYMFDTSGGCLIR